MHHQHVGTQPYDRIRAHAASSTNARVDRETALNLHQAARDASFTEQRLAELDREWDLDRTILLSFAAMGTGAFLLAVAGSRRWRFPLAAQIGSLVAHSLVGWCPPAAVLRRLGFRTRQEIEGERCELMSLRSGVEAEGLATGL